jgi:hypothetical protein
LFRLAGERTGLGRRMALTEVLAAGAAIDDHHRAPT